ncbi:4Fe-4S binding protein [Infirmifilum lucidum]|uniref:4Fe-4S binding protein n=1 Tax=Infirmifilum lucidum TaxID=2776706 RepID=A0A7L9FIW8_9CREN|nr:4Fe-4S binding protein [Infirmifilum lucidum]QOJ78864.1 4Fe-4S binding protein [Infirmifilum lucidum]
MPEVKVVEYPSVPSSEDISRALGELDGLVLVGSWGPAEWLGLREELRRIGARWHRVVYVDRERDPQVSGLSLEDLVASFKAYLESSAGYIAVVVSDAGKRVSRRELLKAGLGVFFVYTAMPEVRAEQCLSLRSCGICLPSCPYGALSQKPPQVSERKCTECGLCASYCPTGLLYVPSHPPTAARRLFHELKSRGAANVIVTCPEGRALVYEDETGLSGAVVELPCIAALRIHEYLFARQVGLRVVPYCPNRLREKCPRGGAAEEYLSLIAETESLLAGRPEATPAWIEKLPALASPLAGDKDEWVQLSRLPLFRVDVNREACTLCGACVKACPAHALTLVRDGGYKLKFTHAECIGCGACMGVCPERAVSVVRAANPLFLSTRQSLEVASSPEAHCKRCGAQIGPEVKIKRLAGRLSRAGVPPAQLERLWLCEKCKQEALADEFREFLSSSSS